MVRQSKYLQRKKSLKSTEENIVPQFGREKRKINSQEEYLVELEKVLREKHGLSLDFNDYRFYPPAPDIPQWAKEFCRKTYSLQEDEEILFMFLDNYRILKMSIFPILQSFSLSIPRDWPMPLIYF